MKIQTTHIRVNDSKPLFNEIASKLADEYKKRGNGKIEIDSFEMGGYTWSCIALIETEFETIDYPDSPPEHKYTEIDVYVVIIQCTDSEGNEIDVTFFDEKNREIGDDELIEIVTLMLTEQY